MDSMEETRQYRTIERRHMIRAKNALAEGLDQLARGLTVDIGFFMACADYLEFNMGRFVRQGVANLRRLRGVVPASDADNWRVIEDIEANLGHTRDHLDRLMQARKLASRGAAGAEMLIDASRQFLEFYNQTLASRKDPAQDIVARYIPPDDYWQATDDVTPESIESEQQLFRQIAELAPAGIQLDPD